MNPNIFLYRFLIFNAKKTPKNSSKAEIIPDLPSEYIQRARVIKAGIIETDLYKTVI